MDKVRIPPKKESFLENVAELNLAKEIKTNSSHFLSCLNKKRTLNEEIEPL